MSPGGWWDGYGEPSDLNRADLAKQNKVTFTSNYNYNSHSFNTTIYVNSSNDTLPIFWIAFGDSSLLTLDVADFSSELRAYPNPVVDFLHIDIETDLINEIRIVDLLGKSNVVALNNGHIDMRNFQDGNYVLLIHCTDGKFLKQKVIKK